MNEEKAEFDLSSKDGRVRITIKTQSVEHLFSLSTEDTMLNNGALMDTERG